MGMNKLKKWVKKNITALTISLHNVEKDLLAQRASSLSDDVKYVKKNTDGTLADNLLKGEVTQEVRNLRWRTYKIFDKMQDIKVNITNQVRDENDESFKAEDYDNSLYQTTTNVKDNKESIKKVKLDSYDDNELELCFLNHEVTLSVLDMFDTKYINEKNEKIDDETTSLGNIEGGDFYSFYKNSSRILIGREGVPKFDIEKYTKKINIRTINDKTKLIEFYVSKYPDEYNKRTSLFISEIKKAMKNPIASSTIDIKSVSFISDKSIGVKDFYLFEYKNLVFDKIVDFDGHYIIKYKGDVTIDGEYIGNKYIEEGLEEKYKNKEAKKISF
jgi:hypothetical protein